MNRYLSRICLVVLICFSASLYAQNQSLNKSQITSQNLSEVKVDELSDEQIAEFWKQSQDKGLSMLQLQQLANQKNMKPEEFNKLKLRIENLSGKQNKLEEEQLDEEKDNDENSKNKTSKAEQSKREAGFRKSKIFGAELFNNKNLTFEPNLKIATPQNYQIGPDDELIVDLSGYSDANFKLKVSADGKIRVPQYGPIMVGGLTIEQARKKITNSLSSVYAGIAAGQTAVNVSLGAIRSIKVTVLGEVNNPGTYTLSSLATVFNSLYVSGGPNKNGSFRNIKVFRNGKQLATLDVYDFLLKGIAKGNVTLRDQDIVKVSSYETRVELTGEVKREGFYEVTAKETLKDVIGFAGGFTDNAYKERIKVYRNTAKEKSVADIPAELIEMFVPKTGDVYTIDKVLPRFANRVQINGAVFRPGYFALDEGLTLSKLIKKADGLTEEAFTSRALIYRLKDDNSLEAISFNVSDVMAGKDIELKREDNIQILSKLKLREEYTVSIAGEVLSPGNYPFAENLTVEDLIITAGGLKESASKAKIEVARRVKMIDVNNANSEVSKIFIYEVNDSLKTSDGNTIVLLPFDVVSIYKLPGFQMQRNITLEGEVTHPGQYTLTRNNEKISEVLKRAGGLTGNAFPDGAILVRTKRLTGIELYVKKKQQESLEKLSKDSVRAKEIKESESLYENVSVVGINLSEILRAPGSSVDLILEENDVIRIPRPMQTVKVSGEVLYPISIQYQKGKRFKKYINGAGGYTQKALRKRGYVIYPNGSAKSTSKFLLVFNHHPKIKPGSEIIMPPREDKKKVSAVEVAAITSSLATLMLVIFTISSTKTP